MLEVVMQTFLSNLYGTNLVLVYAVPVFMLVIVRLRRTAPAKCPTWRLAITICSHDLDTLIGKGD